MKKKLRITMKVKLLIITTGLILISNGFVGIRNMKASVASITATTDKVLEMQCNEVAFEVNKLCDEQFNMLEALANIAMFKDRTLILNQK